MIVFYQLFFVFLKIDVIQIIISNQNKVHHYFRRSILKSFILYFF